MKSKLYRIFGALFCILIISSFYAWNGTMRNHGIYPSTTANEFKSYSGLDNKIHFELPASWTFTERKFENSEIKFHGDFISSDNILRGIIQFWEIKKPLLAFLQDSKLGASGVVEYKYYRIEEAKIGEKDGYILEYSKKANDNKYYNSVEYFVPEGNNSFLRMSFYTEEKNYKPEYKKLFDNIASRMVYTD